MKKSERSWNRNRTHITKGKIYYVCLLRKPDRKGEINKIFILSVNKSFINKIFFSIFIKYETSSLNKFQKKKKKKTILHKVSEHLQEQEMGMKNVFFHDFTFCAYLLNTTKIYYKIIY